MTGAQYYSDPQAAEDYADSYKGATDTASYYLAQILASAVPDKSIFTGGLLVDLGCGPGNSSVPFIESFGFKKLIAVDGSSAMLEHVEEYISDKNVEVKTQLADLVNDHICTEAGTADVAICCSMLGFVSDMTHIFNEAHRILKPGGYFGFNILVQSVHDTPYRPENLTFDIDVFLHPTSAMEVLWEQSGFEFVSKMKTDWDRTITQVATDHLIYLLRKKV